MLASVQFTALNKVLGNIFVGNAGGNPQLTRVSFPSLTAALGTLTYFKNVALSVFDVSALSYAGVLNITGNSI